MPWNKPPEKVQSANARANAPRLRKATTEAEKRLWQHLREMPDLGQTHFRRQVAIGIYVVDFCCLKHRLIIEVDGEIHKTDEAMSYDRQRDEYLRAEGFRILRFSNAEVLLGRERVLNSVRLALGGATPTPYPSPQGGGEVASGSTAL
ncbi:endonuclease domain-containing protein [Mesorhizobium sp. DCY119]|uniref:endonuclease domain-containing protein n=1 Tax=Mesorhizobium sp. DCY119 TaxID=2108445 RepID=UPI001FE0899A|nr:endonuclease domain-containing protein [Mesorhizobium sp. DCY119]